MRIDLSLRPELRVPASSGKSRGIGLILLLLSLCPSLLTAQARERADSVLLDSLLAAESAAHDLSYPFPAELVAGPEASAFIEVAIEGALRTFTTVPSTVFIADGKLTVRLQHPNLGKEDEESQLGADDIERIRHARRQYERDLKELERIDTRLREFLPSAFAQEIVVQIDIIEEPSAGLSALNALGELPRRDIISDAANNSRIDYRSAWNVIFQRLRRDGFSIDDTYEGPNRYELSTVPIPAHDSRWLYQTFHTVKIWDPYANNPRSAGRYLRIEVCRVVKRRKQSSPFQTITRSGPREEQILSSLINTLSSR